MSSDTLTITLTGRRPVTIVKDDWPVMASADAHNGREVESQATSRWRLTVRQHQADGRTIVYAAHMTRFAGEVDRRGGELLTPPTGATVPEDAYLVWPEIPAAIQRVALDVLGEDLGERMARECIADLPAEVL